MVHIDGNQLWLKEGFWQYRAFRRDQNVRTPPVQLSVCGGQAVGVCYGSWWWGLTCCSTSRSNSLVNLLRSRPRLPFEGAENRPPRGFVDCDLCVCNTPEPSRIFSRKCCIELLSQPLPRYRKPAGWSRHIAREDAHLIWGIHMVCIGLYGGFKIVGPRT